MDPIKNLYDKFANKVVIDPIPSLYQKVNASKAKMEECQREYEAEKDPGMKEAWSTIALVHQARYQSNVTILYSTLQTLVPEPPTKSS